MSEISSDAEVSAVLCKIFKGVSLADGSAEYFGSVGFWFVVLILLRLVFRVDKR